MNTSLLFPIGAGSLRKTSLRAPIIAIALASIAGVSAQTRLGNPYRPAGANYNITAYQGIDDAHPGGTTSGAQVNRDFEFTPSIGVTYTNSKGKMTDFGLGLYQASKKGSLQSTGLMITYDAIVKANTANVTVMDFDLKGNATGFNPKKVEPVIDIYGAGGTLLTSAGPSEVFSVMHLEGQADTWSINMGSLLAAKGVSASGISAVRLSADWKHGEGKSDPYLLKSASNPTVVPEPATLSVIGIGALFLRRRKKA